MIENNDDEKNVNYIISQFVKKIFKKSNHNFSLLENDIFIYDKNTFDSSFDDKVPRDYIVVDTENFKNLFLYTRSSNYINYFCNIFNKQPSILHIPSSSKINLITNSTSIMYIFLIPNEYYYKYRYKYTKIDYTIEDKFNDNIITSDLLLLESKMENFNSDPSLNIINSFEKELNDFHELDYQNIYKKYDACLLTEYLEIDYVTKKYLNQFNFWKIINSSCKNTEDFISNIFSNIHDSNFQESNEIFIDDKNDILISLLMFFKNFICDSISNTYNLDDLDIESISIYRYDKDTKKNHNFLSENQILSIFYLNDTVCDDPTPYDTIFSREYNNNNTGNLTIHTNKKNSILKTNSSQFKYVLLYKINYM